MKKPSKKVIIVLGIILVIIILIIIAYFIMKKDSSETVTNTTSTDATGEETIEASDKYSIDEGSLAFDKNGESVAIDYENGIMKKADKTYNIGDLSNAYPIFVFSPDSDYAVGSFFKIEDGKYYFYLLSQKNPQKINEFVEEVGAVNNDGSMVYFADGEIRKGNPNTTNNTVLVASEDIDGMYVAFAQLDNDNLLYWGLPTEPQGLNMYSINTQTGIRTDIITDSTVVDASLSTNKDSILVNRYFGEETESDSGTYSSWIYSLSDKQFTKELPVNFEARTCAWSSDDTTIAYWDNSTLSTINIKDDSVIKINTFPTEYNYQEKMLGYENNKIIILPQ